MPCALIGGGNHQVLAAKKYAMIAVSIQTTGASSIDSPPLRGPSSLYCIRTWNEIITLDQVRATPVTDSGYRFTKIPANRGAAFQAPSRLPCPHFVGHASSASKCVAAPAGADLEALGVKP